MSGLREIEPQRRPSVAHDAIVAANRAHQREHRRPSALTARDGLIALEFESLLVWTAAQNIVAGVVLTDDDLDRLTTACRWIAAIRSEVAP